VSTLLIWVCVAFAMTASAGAMVLVNKRLTRCLDPVATNMLVRGVAVITIAVVSAPPTLLHLWSLTYDMTWEATGYVALIAVVGWFVAQNAYYHALRSGKVSVVAPLTSTNLLFTALWATALVGAALGNLTVAGLLIAAAGIVFIARVQRRDTVAAEGPDPQQVVVELQPGAAGLEPAAAADLRQAAAAGLDPPQLVLETESGGAAGESPVEATAVLLAEEQPAPPSRWERSVPLVVLLALVSAAGWGLGPVLIQLAQQSVGGTTVSMILIAQGLGFLLLLGFVAARRAPLTARPLTALERRRMPRLVLFIGMFEGAYAIGYYLLVQNLGPVLAAMISATTPVWAIVWGGLLLRERIGLRLGVGIGVTLLGVFLATADRVL
jgi:drug/metabolite transporter (DMT)-like permease